MARNALGRGLGALIRDSDPQPAVATAAATAPARSPSGPQLVDIDLIDPSPYQPRTRFREEGLAELAHREGVELPNRTADGVAVFGLVELDGQHTSSCGPLWDRAAGAYLDGTRLGSGGTLPPCQTF